jgi:hypothetical protein
MQYEHYKNKKLYEIIGVALHSETKEEMIIYKALYDCAEFGPNQIWVRPKAMFFENVFYNGVTMPRFRLINE